MQGVRLFPNPVAIGLTPIPALSTGARGNAKPKPCSNCEGKGWSYVQTPVSNETQISCPILNEPSCRFHLLREH